ncbi:MAG: pentapeptide repeat-containing protein, partial [Cyanobacteria bacterium J06641_2]
QNRLIVITFLLLVIVLISWFIWEAPQWQVSNINNIKDRITVENAIRGNLVQAIGGLFLFVTGYLSWRNLQVTQETQVTERFAKAVEYLGSENIHVRLGAIYSLERIARDSGKDYWQVMEILTAYVRERAPDPPRKEDIINQPLWLTLQNLHKKENYLSATEDSKEADIIPIETDIQAVLTVISRRSKSYSRGEINPLDLSCTNLSKANLSEADLSKVNFYKANLSRVNLSKANLSNANLCEADLSNANLIEVNVSEALLWNTNLSAASLSGADLNKASLSGADLNKAIFGGVEIWLAASSDLKSKKHNPLPN